MSEQKLTIVVNIHAVQGKEDLIHKELQKLVIETRKETGCEQFDLHRNNKDPRHFLLFEIWESWGLWQIHRQTQHLADYRKATEGCVAKFELNEMTKD